MIVHTHPSKSDASKPSVSRTHTVADYLQTVSVQQAIRLTRNAAMTEKAVFGGTVSSQAFKLVLNVIQNFPFRNTPKQTHQFSLAALDEERSTETIGQLVPNNGPWKADRRAKAAILAIQVITESCGRLKRELLPSSKTLS